MKQTINYK